MKLTRAVVFTSLYITYLLYVYVRRSFAYVMPAVAKAQNLDKTQLGLILSCQNFAYAISKFISGVLVDVVSPRLLLSLGLVCSGVTTVLFTVHDSHMVMSLCWFLNGMSEGPGWPSIAVILRKWCNPEQLGTAWSVLSTSMNVAGILGPLVTAYVLIQSDWRDCMRLAGLVAIVLGCVSFVFVKNKPDCGTKSESVKEQTNKDDEDVSRWKLLKIPGFLGVCCLYMTTALVQNGVLQWSQLFIVQERGQSLLTGSAFMSSVDLGGVFGSFVAGYLSDYLISKNPSLPRTIARKVMIMIFSIFLIVVLCWFTCCIGPDTSKVIVTLMGFVIGFGIYGPIAIFGVVAMESGPEKYAGTLHAIACLFSNAGIMMSGLPLGYIAKVSDWNTAFFVQCTLIVVNVSYLFMKLRSDFKYHPNFTLGLFSS